jgi:hypothetical protein
VVQVDPEATVQFEDRQGSIDRVNLRTGCKYRWKQDRHNGQDYGQAYGSEASHGEVPDGIANRANAQIGYG